MKRFRHFIGIDISKNELDYAVMYGKEFLFHREAKNEKHDIIAFINELKALPGFMIAKTVFCMEHTGVYGNHLLSVLKSVKANIVIEGSNLIKNSLGVVRGKYDKIDAIRIATYAYINRDNLRLRESKRPVILRLGNLFTLRNRLQGVIVSLKTPLKDQSAFVKKGIHKEVTECCSKTIDALQNDIKNIEDAIDRLIASDQRLNRLNELVTSVFCIGRVIAIQLIVSTNEFIDIPTAKKLACYAGIAPFKTESGLMKGKSRVSSYANKKVKALLHIGAMSAISRPGELRVYYQRKVEEGKPKMSVINAIRNKLISRVYACLTGDRLYKKDYVRPVVLMKNSNEN